jgi:plastocyanin
MKYFNAFLLFIILILIMQGCGGTETYEISINSNSYSPDQLVVNTGAEVTWINNDSKPHTVSSGVKELWKFDSGTIEPGGSFTLKFIEEFNGPYTYYCKIHGNQEMEGTIVVNPEKK